MNDKCVLLLNNYDIEVLRTAKGRGAVLCETNCGLLILKEYIGRKSKVVMQEKILSHIQEKGTVHAEQIIRNKENELLTQDTDGTFYFLKTYFNGRECNMKETRDCERAMQSLAALHDMTYPFEEDTKEAQTVCVDEYQRHNRELTKIKKYIRTRSQKTDFEILLWQTYDYYLEQALATAKEIDRLRSGMQKVVLCHGDYQYHNVLFQEDELFIINFEKCIRDDPTRDISLFLRKILEKSGWKTDLGFSLLKSYEHIRKMEAGERQMLYLRLAYPEKFWKITNFYYNSGKAFIPGKNKEKLQKLMDQEEEKKCFLSCFREQYLD